MSSQESGVSFGAMLVETAPMRTGLSKSIFMLAASMATFFSCAGAMGRPAIWPDGFLSRVELLALIQTLNASLLASRSATATLENWCAAHKMAAEPKVIARRIHDAEKTPSEETRQRLRVEPNETVKYRHVQLACGDHILSEADNWYVPSRLSDEMNRLLENTETPFGKAVQSLQPFRRTIEMKLRWTPLPEGWELEALAPHRDDGGGALQIPHEILEHRAILYTSDQKPFSEVRETYTSDVLDFETTPAPGKE